MQSQLWVSSQFYLIYRAVFTSYCLDQLQLLTLSQSQIWKINLRYGNHRLPSSDKFINELTYDFTTPPHNIRCPSHDTALRFILWPQQWVDGLSDDLKYNEDNLRTQLSLWETNINCNTWCFCFMHALHACSVMALSDVSTAWQYFLPIFSTLLPRQIYI